jgi:two-component system sensor histidine kinase UhpB
MKAARLEGAPAPVERLAVACEDERRRLARDLHDGPAQSLAAALFAVDIAIRALERSPDTARDELTGARELVRDALDDVRSMMTGLRPRLLEERGLVAALESLAAMPPLWGPDVRVEARGQVGQRLPPELALGLYRIAQEAVSNARRHSGASRVVVSLYIDRDMVTLEVGDDGHGFSVSDAASGVGRGEGIPGMRERALLLGAHLAIVSRPREGTRVIVTVPLDRPE